MAIENCTPHQKTDLSEELVACPLCKWVPAAVPGLRKEAKTCQWNGHIMECPTSGIGAKHAVLVERWYLKGSYQDSASGVTVIVVPNSNKFACR